MISFILEVTGKQKVCLSSSKAGSSAAGAQSAPSEPPSDHGSSKQAPTQ